MPSVVNRNVSVSEVVSSIHARLTKLESFPPSGMTLLASYTNNTGVNFSGSAEAIITGLKTPTFTTIRPLPVFVIGTTTIGAQAQEASAQYETRVVISGDARDLLNVGGNASFTSIYVFAMSG